MYISRILKKKKHVEVGGGPTMQCVPHGSRSRRIRRIRWAPGHLLPGGSDTAALQAVHALLFGRWKRRRSMGLPYMPTLTPQATPTDRPLSPIHGASGGDSL